MSKKAEPKKTAAKSKAVKAEPTSKPKPKKKPVVNQAKTMRVPTVRGPRGGGAMVVFGPKEIAQVEALGAFLSWAQIADYMGISERTIHAVQERQPEVGAAYKKGKSNAILDAASSLAMQARDGNVTAAIFMLKTQAGWSEKQQVEVTSPDGSLSAPPSVIQIVGVSSGEPDESD